MPTMWMFFMRSLLPMPDRVGGRLQPDKIAQPSSGEHLIGAINLFGFCPEVFLHLDAEVGDAVLVVFQPRLLVGGADGFGPRVARHAEHGIRIELFFDGRRRRWQVSASHRIFLLFLPRVFFPLTQPFLLAEPRFLLLLQHRLTPLLLLEGALLALLLVGG